LKLEVYIHSALFFHIPYGCVSNSNFSANGWGKWLNNIELNRLPNHPSTFYSNTNFFCSKKIFGATTRLRFRLMDHLSFSIGFHVSFFPIISTLYRIIELERNMIFFLNCFIILPISFYLLGDYQLVTDERENEVIFMLFN
jgi:hypothetical protein